MPKMKTKKSASKRFVVRNSGSIKRGQAFKRHILTKKTTKAKRHLRGASPGARGRRQVGAPHDAVRVRRRRCLESNVA